MTTIPLTSALRLMRQFVDNPDTADVIVKTIAELERLYKIEAELIALREHPAPDPATWQEQNRMATR